MIAWSLNQTVAPTERPVSRVEAKAHLVLDSIDDDTYVDGLIHAATLWAEGFTRRQLVSATYELKLDRFPRGNAPIQVPRPPLSSVTSIAYVDTAGDSQTWAGANYTTDTASTPGRIEPAYGVDYPDTRDQIAAVTVTFVAGFGAASAVPYNYKAAIQQLVAGWYATREPVVVGTTASAVPLSAESLLWHDRVFPLEPAA